MGFRLRFELGLGFGLDLGFGFGLELGLGLRLELLQAEAGEQRRGRLPIENAIADARRRTF